MTAADRRSWRALGSPPFGKDFPIENKVVLGFVSQKSVFFPKLPAARVVTSEQLVREGLGPCPQDSDRTPVLMFTMFTCSLLVAFAGLSLRLSGAAEAPCPLPQNPALDVLRTRHRLHHSCRGRCSPLSASFRSSIIAVGVIIRVDLCCFRERSSLSPVTRNSAWLASASASR